MQVPLAATNDLQWWIKNLYSLNGRLILQPSKDYDAATDACDYGWGAWIKTHMETISWGGLFSRHQIYNLHINQKELLAILLFLRSCPIDLTNKVVDIGIDNTTALFSATTRFLIIIVVSAGAVVSVSWFLSQQRESGSLSSVTAAASAVLTQLKQIDISPVTVALTAGAVNTWDYLATKTQ